MAAEAPHPPKSPDPLRAAANRRIAVFVAVFALLLVGAIALVLREERRRAFLVQPIPKPDHPSSRPVSIPRPTPEPPPPAAPAPTSPALLESAQMAEALAAFREAGEHLVAKRFDAAEERASAALRAYPKMAAAQRILGLVYLHQGRIERAIAILEASLRNEPFNPESLTNLAFASLQAQNPAVALELIETCRRLHPDYKPALLQHGLMLMSEPGSPDAIAVLREAVVAFPNLPGPRNNLAVALARSGDRDGARAELQRLVEIDPLNFSGLYNLGAICAQETNAPAAVSWLRRAMALVDPAEFRHYLNDPDLAPIRSTPEYKQFILELDPVLPGPPGPRPPSATAP